MIFRTKSLPRITHKITFTTTYSKKSTFLFDVIEHRLFPGKKSLEVKMCSAAVRNEIEIIKHFHSF